MNSSKQKLNTIAKCITSYLWEKQMLMIQYIQDFFLPSANPMTTFRGSLIKTPLAPLATAIYKIFHLKEKTEHIFCAG